MTYLFEDRRDAGKQLGKYLKDHHKEDVVILALPRGGVVVADEVAEQLQVSLNVVIARKIGAPGQPEYGIGALSEDAKPTFNSTIPSYYSQQNPIVRKTIADEIDELNRRKKIYRDGEPLPDMKNKTVIVVDDGLATGVTAVAAAKFLRTLHPLELILAVPVGPSDINTSVRGTYDEVICLHSLDNLQAVGLWYENFDQTEDDEVLSILGKYQ